LFFNICPRTLDQDADDNDWLRDAVEQAGLAPGPVVIEITERFGGRAASIVKCLQRLRLQGFKIAVDDVGTGNSGLAILRQVKVEFVKIDRSIVAAAPTDPGARAVLMAIATYARQTGAFVLAE
jgi:EAL domain-containing protein (putative c-di-GMP-specific phosphodiesterase class I)